MPVSLSTPFPTGRRKQHVSVDTGERRVAAARGDHYWRPTPCAGKVQPVHAPCGKRSRQAGSGVPSFGDGRRGTGERGSVDMLVGNADSWKSSTCENATAGRKRVGTCRHESAEPHLPGTLDRRAKRTTRPHVGPPEGRLAEPVWAGTLVPLPISWAPSCRRRRIAGHLVLALANGGQTCLSGAGMRRHVGRAIGGRFGCG